MFDKIEDDMRDLPWLLLGGLLAAPVSAEELDRKPESGTVHFVPAPGKVPSYHELGEHTFPFTLKPRTEFPVAGIAISDLTFPSPVESPHPQNNTVYAEYYRPTCKGPFPAVIVLDILDGGEIVPRTQAQMFAQNGVAALHVKMAYYGPRRPAGSGARLVSMNLPMTLAAVRQTVLDLRRATAWLESRPEIDGKKLGIMGTSLGSFLAALTAESEPKISKVALLYGGGGFVEGYCDHPRAKQYLDNMGKIGITKDVLKTVIAKVDPITCAGNLKGRDVLLIAAKRDDVVPPKMAAAMWEACGKPKIVWYDTTHYGAVLFVFPALREVLAHFQWK
jgi:dienelactone hydrolase